MGRRDGEISNVRDQAAATCHCGRTVEPRDPDPWEGRMDDYCEDCAINRCDCYPDECPIKHPQASSAAQDRTVHAVTYKGVEIVRYDRAGEWWIEWPSGSLIPGKRVGVAEAARTAVDHSGDIRLGLPGGKVFDAKVRTLRGF